MPLPDRGSDSPPRPAISRVKVWDIPTRIFHWALASLILLSWISVDIGLMHLHLWSGSAVLILLLFRTAWGVVGSTTARFQDFVVSPTSVLNYLRTLRRQEKSYYAGHNPAGGWMVIAMLTTLFAQTTTGMFSNDGVRFHGPLSLYIPAVSSDRFTEIHGLLFNLLLILIYLHVVAVFFYLLVKGENLIAPMVTGNKLRTHVPNDRELRFTSLAVALTVIAVVIAVAIAVVWWVVSRG